MPLLFFLSPPQSMHSTHSKRHLAAPLTMALLALATQTQATTQNTAQHDKKAAQQASAKKAAAAPAANHVAAPAKKSARKAAGKPVAPSPKAAPAKPPKAVAETPAAPPKPVIPPELVRRISSLEDNNKALETRISELAQDLAAANRRHDELKTRVDNPPPLPKPEVPAGPLVLTGLVGALLGLLGSLAGGLLKGRLSRAKEKDVVPFPAPAEPMTLRQEPTVS